MVEGEKDPRNLMISFGLIRVMLLEFEVEGVVEVRLYSHQLVWHNVDD